MPMHLLLLLPLLLSACVNGKPIVPVRASACYTTHGVRTCGSYSTVDGVALTVDNAKK